MIDCQCPVHSGGRYTGNYHECDHGYSTTHLVKASDGVESAVFIWHCECELPANLQEK